IWVARPDEARRAPIDRFEVQAPAPSATPPEPVSPPQTASRPEPARAPSRSRPAPAAADRVEPRALKDARSAAPARPQEANDAAESERRDRAVAAPAAPSLPAATPPPGATDGVALVRKVELLDHYNILSDMYTSILLIRSQFVP